MHRTRDSGLRPLARAGDLYHYACFFQHLAPPVSENQRFLRHILALGSGFAHSATRIDQYHTRRFFRQRLPRKHGQGRLCWVTRSGQFQFHGSALHQRNEPGLSGFQTWSVSTLCCAFLTYPTESRPPLHRWGIPPAHLNPFSARRLPLAMMPKSLKYKTRIWAIMLKNFRISSPNGR
jgi:hypothetical protein